MKNTNPLTVEEVTQASEQFFPLFEVILSKMPEGSKIEDCLKVMETVCTLAQKNRAEKEEVTGPFGFNKKTETDTESRLHFNSYDEVIAYNNKNSQPIYEYPISVFDDYSGFDTITLG